MVSAGLMFVIGCQWDTVEAQLLFICFVHGFVFSDVWYGSHRHNVCCIKLAAVMSFPARSKAPLLRSTFKKTWSLSHCLYCILHKQVDNITRSSALWPGFLWSHLTCQYTIQSTDMSLAWVTGAFMTAILTPKTLVCFWPRVVALLLQQWFAARVLSAVIKMD